VYLLDTSWRIALVQANVMPEFETTVQLVDREFTLDRRLAGYDVYRRR
jgi:hypothetical protein